MLQSVEGWDLMGQVQSRNFDTPHEEVSLPNFTGQIVVLGEWEVARFVHQPGWSWTKDVKPLAGTATCQYHHQGVLISGRLQITTDGGAPFLALFDGTARAVRCAAAICRVARKDNIEVRVGVHSGEVERHTHRVRGVAVHVTARIAAIAGAGEVRRSA